MDVSHTFAESELVKATLQWLILAIDFAPKKLASLHVQASQHAMCVNEFPKLMVWILLF